VWLRVADPGWLDALDPSWAGDRGGRWNPPRSHATLYLNGDVRTARLQIDRMLAGSPVIADDLDDEAYVLTSVTLPRSQVCADATTASALRGLGLPDSYPLAPTGAMIPNADCQPVGVRVHGDGLRGVWCRSAATMDGSGRELAWFPAGSRSRAHAVWPAPLPFGDWRFAAGWEDIGLEPQPDPASDEA
jgi:RES domain